jgi:hypothetical protein
MIISGINKRLFLITLDIHLLFAIKALKIELNNISDHFLILWYLF